MIQFRTQRMATSVVNRILNLYNGPLKPETTEPGAPDAPAALPEGDALTRSMASPKPPTDATPAAAEEIALSPLVK